MSKAKKPTEPLTPKLDTLVLCDKCPGNLRIRADAYHGAPYLPNHTCGVCKRAFSPDAVTLTPDTDATNTTLKEREPKIIEFRLEQALKTIEAKDRDIALLKERVDSYERAMQYMGGGPFAGMRSYMGRY